MANEFETFFAIEFDHSLLWEPGEHVGYTEYPIMKFATSKEAWEFARNYKDEEEPELQARAVEVAAVPVRGTRAFLPVGRRYYVTGIPPAPKMNAPVRIMHRVAQPSSEAVGFADLPGVLEEFFNQGYQNMYVRSAPGWEKGITFHISKAEWDKMGAASANT